MLTDPSIEKLKEKSASPYDLTVLVSKRARELTDGAQPMIDAEGAANVVSLACREVAADKVVAVKGDVEDEAVIPITREEKIRRREEAENRRKTWIRFCAGAFPSKASRTDGFRLKIS